jgi:hypothetical protein
VRAGRGSLRCWPAAHVNEGRVGNRDHLGRKSPLPPSGVPVISRYAATRPDIIPGPAIEVLAALPLEKRYVWRVASALKWAFVDFDSLTVEADRQTISPEDRQQLVDILKHRPLQFLSTLFGQKEMELMMLSAIKNTRAMAVSSDRDL